MVYVARAPVVAGLTLTRTPRLPLAPMTYGAAAIGTVSALVATVKSATVPGARVRHPHQNDGDRVAWIYVITRGEGDDGSVVGLVTPWVGRRAAGRVGEATGDEMPPCRRV